MGEHPTARPTGEEGEDEDQRHERDRRDQPAFLDDLEAVGGLAELVDVEAALAAVEPGEERPDDERGAAGKVGRGDQPAGQARWRHRVSRPRVRPAAVPVGPAEVG